MLCKNDPSNGTFLITSFMSCLKRLQMFDEGMEFGQRVRGARGIGRWNWTALQLIEFGLEGLVGEVLSRRVGRCEANVSRNVAAVEMIAKPPGMTIHARRKKPRKS